MTRPEFPARAIGDKSTQQIVGPYYFVPAHVRSDLREGQAGIELDLALRIQNSATGAPIAGCAVDVWGCNSEGRYSGFDYIHPDYAPGVTGERDENGFIRKGDAQWLRGRQVTDADGVVRFTTIFPAWYFSRDVHLHAMVYVGDTPCLVTQVYFEAALVEAILTDPRYARERDRDTHYEDDWVRHVSEADDGELVAARFQDGRVIGAATLAFDPDAAPEVDLEKTIVDYIDDFPPDKALWRFDKSLFRKPGSAD